MAKPTVPFRKITANPSQLVDCPPPTERTRLGDLHKNEEGQSDMNMMSSINMLGATPLGEDGPGRSRTLNEQIANLDTVALADRYDYPWVWLSEVKETGASILLGYAADGSKSLQVGCSCDEHLEDRLIRTKALATHMDMVDGARAEIMRIMEVEHPTQVMDFRPKNLRKTFAIVRDFLATGHRLFIDRKGRVQTGGSFPREWLTAERPRQIEIEKAARAYFELREKWHTDRYLKRIIRSLGKLHDGSGCIVLDGEIA